jgi:predicted nucleic-acid-binding protein
MASAAVDTNVVVRVIVGDDVREAKRALARLAEPGWISHVILKETMWVLRRIYEYDAPAICEVLEGLLMNDVFVVEEPLVVGAALERLKENPTIGFHDCLALEVARARGHLPLLTFDKALAKLEGAELV